MDNEKRPRKKKRELGVPTPRVGGRTLHIVRRRTSGITTKTETRFDTHTAALTQGQIPWIPRHLRSERRHAMLGSRGPTWHRTYSETRGGQVYNSPITMLTLVLRFGAQNLQIRASHLSNRGQQQSSPQPHPTPRAACPSPSPEFPPLHQPPKTPAPPP